MRFKVDVEVDRDETTQEMLDETVYWRTPPSEGLVPINDALNNLRMSVATQIMQGYLALTDEENISHIWSARVIRKITITLANDN